MWHTLSRFSTRARRTLFRRNRALDGSPHNSKTTRTRNFFTLRRTRKMKKSLPNNDVDTPPVFIDMTRKSKPLENKSLEDLKHGSLESTKIYGSEWAAKTAAIEQSPPPQAPPRNSRGNSRRKPNTGNKKPSFNMASHRFMQQNHVETGGREAFASTRTVTNNSWNIRSMRFPSLNTFRTLKEKEAAKRKLAEKVEEESRTRRISSDGDESVFIDESNTDIVLQAANKSAFEEDYEDDEFVDSENNDVEVVDYTKQYQNNPVARQNSFMRASRRVRFSITDYLFKKKQDKTLFPDNNDPAMQSSRSMATTRESVKRFDKYNTNTNPNNVVPKQPSMRFASIRSIRKPKNKKNADTAAPKPAIKNNFWNNYVNDNQGIFEEVDPVEEEQLEEQVQPTAHSVMQSMPIPSATSTTTPSPMTVTRPMQVKSINTSKPIRKQKKKSEGEIKHTPGGIDENFFRLKANMNSNKKSDTIKGLPVKKSKFDTLRSRFTDSRLVRNNNTQVVQKIVEDVKQTANIAGNRSSVQSVESTGSHNSIGSKLSENAFIKQDSNNGVVVKNQTDKRGTGHFRNGSRSSERSSGSSPEDEEIRDEFKDVKSRLNTSRGAYKKNTLQPASVKFNSMGRKSGY